MVIQIIVQKKLKWIITIKKKNHHTFELVLPITDIDVIKMINRKREKNKFGNKIKGKEQRDEE